MATQIGSKMSPETKNSEESSFKRNGESAYRRTVRYFAGGMSTLTAIMYLLIGFHVVSVLEGNVDQTWGLFAATAYILGALLLFASDYRVFWALGAILQVFVIFTYFNVAPQRTPAFEVWGILIRIAQSALLIALVYLVSYPHAKQTGDPISH